MPIFSIITETIEYYLFVDKWDLLDNMKVSSFVPSLLAATGIALAANATPAQAVQFGFDNITGNDTGNVATGESQLFVDVTDAGNNQVNFRFFNTGPNASSITQIYFDDGTLLGIASITGSSNGVNYQQPTSGQNNLPGGNTIDFDSTREFRAFPSPPVQPNGVNPGEYVDITFNLLSGVNYQDTLDAMALSLANPGVDVTNGLRIGIHVQGYANGGSESFVNGSPTPVTPPTPVPEPLTILGTAVVLGFGGLCQREMPKKRKQAKGIVV